MGKDHENKVIEIELGIIIVLLLVIILKDCKQKKH
jgi:hypothetical protein